MAFTGAATIKTRSLDLESLAEDLKGLVYLERGQDAILELAYLGLAYRLAGRTMDWLTGEDES